MWNLTHGYADLSRQLDTMVQPWLFPLFPGSVSFFMPVYLSFVVLISDAPFRSRQQQFVLLRAGKRNWIMGQLLYIVMLSVVFTAALWFFSWVFLIPRVRWSLNWGPILTTVATRNLNLEIALMPVSYEIMMNVTPLAATAWAAFMMIGVNILLGEIVMVCNLWAKRAWAR